MSASKTNQDLESSILSHERYILNRRIGKGCWGVVYSAKDVKLDKEVAIKVFSPNELALQQSLYRNLDAFKVMVKEEAELKACSNIVPRRFEFDKQGIPFIVMPKYENFLSDILQNNLQRNHLKQGLNIEQVIAYARDIANGVLEMHTKLRRVHGDIKADNVAVDEHGNLLLNDLGTSTFASFGQSVSPRDNMGFIYTRAPECFLEGSRPTKQSDIWSFGSLLYGMFTGEYVFEKDLDSYENLKDFITDISEDKLNWNARITEKVDYAKIPKSFRKLLKKCLCNPEDRIKDATELSHLLDKSIHKYEKSQPKQRIKRYGLAVVAFAILLPVGQYVVNHLSQLTKSNQELTQKLDYEKKLRSIKLWKETKGIGGFGQSDREGAAEVRAWNIFFEEKYGIKDEFLLKELAFAAYLDTNLFYAALQDAKKRIKPGEEFYEPEIWAKPLWKSQYEYMRAICMAGPSGYHPMYTDPMRVVQGRWGKAKQAYEFKHPKPKTK